MFRLECFYNLLNNRINWPTCFSSLYKEKKKRSFFFFFFLLFNDNAFYYFQCPLLFKLPDAIIDVSFLFIMNILDFVTLLIWLTYLFGFMVVSDMDERMYVMGRRSSS